MKLLYLLILTVFLCPSIASAQRNFKPGYVVTLKGDTVKGFINYKDWNKNPSQISFKNSIASKAVTYNTSNASAFVVTGYEYYKRYAGKISQDGVDVTYLSRGLDSAYKTDTVFLRAISTGKNITLYEYIDIIKDRYFIADGNAPAAELAYHVYFDLTNTSRVDKDRGYMQQLQLLAAKYQPTNTKLFDKISNTEYVLDGLKKIAQKINGSTAVATAFSAQGHSSTRLYAGIGANITNVAFTGTSDFTGVNASNYTFPMVNLGLDIFLNREVGNLLVRINLGLTRNTSSFIENTATPFGASTSSVFKFNQNLAILNAQLLYNICNTTAFKLYLAAGAAANISVYSNQQSYVTSSSTGGTTTTRTTSEDLQQLYMSATGKLGVVLGGNIDIYLGYSPGANIFTSEDYTIKLTSYQAGINFLFGK